MSEPSSERDQLSERLEREHEQLFHELRSVIPGAEVLFAFLLTIAFTPGFVDLGDRQQTVYYLTFVCSGLALILLLAPTAFHRIRFRQQDKNAMIRLANIEVLAAMFLISVSVAGVVYLVTDVALGTIEASIVAPVLWLLTTVLWWAVPLARFRGDTAAPEDATVEVDPSGRGGHTAPAVNSSPSEA